MVIFIIYLTSLSPIYFSYMLATYFFYKKIRKIIQESLYLWLIKICFDYG